MKQLEGGVFNARFWMFVAVMIGIGLFWKARSAEDELRGVIGWQGVKFPERVFSHDTHGDDYYLEDAETPGSAGTTTIGGHKTNYLALGLEYQRPIVEPIHFFVGAGYLLGNEDDVHSNMNDNRPPADAAFVYSEARYGLYGQIGFSAMYRRFEVGVSGQLTSLYESHGWDRFGSTQKVEDGFNSNLSFGPSVTYEFMEDHLIQVGVQTGGAKAVSISWAFRL